MISPAAYHRMPDDWIMSKTSVPLACVWLNRPVSAMYRARSRASPTRRVSSRSLVRPWDARRALVRFSASYSAADTAAVLVSESGAVAEPGFGRTMGCPRRIGQVQRVVLGGGRRRSTGVVVGCGRRWDESDHEHGDDGDGTKAAEKGKHATM